MVSLQLAFFLLLSIILNCLGWWCCIIVQNTPPTKMQYNLRSEMKLYRFCLRLRFLWSFKWSWLWKIRVRCGTPKFKRAKFMMAFRRKFYLNSSSRIQRIYTQCCALIVNVYKVAATQWAHKCKTRRTQNLFTVLKIIIVYGCVAGLLVLGGLWTYLQRTIIPL